jgi:molybdate transport system ATP-binding protein
VVFQDALLFPHLTVEANLRYGQRHRRFQKRAVDFHRVIEVLEIGGLLKRFPRNLSGGEKQRVALGRTLLSGPELLLMDEPMASLDAPLKTRILAYLERAVAEWDIPTLYVTHSQAEVRRAADRVVVMEKGRVVASGTPEDALGQPEPLGWGNSASPVNLVRLDRVELTDGQLKGWVGSQPLSLPPQTSAAMPRFVQFSPADVFLSKQDVAGISARNHLRGRVCRLARSKQAVFVAIDIGQIIWAEVTPAAVDELNLRPGVEVFCLLKTQGLGLAD